MNGGVGVGLRSEGLSLSFAEDLDLYISVIV